MSATEARSTMNKFSPRVNIGNFPTPFAFLQTLCGQVPFLTEDLFQSIPRNNSPAVALRMPHFFGHDTLIMNSKKTLTEYINAGDAKSFLLIRDPYRYVRPDNKEDGLMLEAVSGRKKITPSDYINFLKNSQPDFAVAFHDEVPNNVGNNRTRRGIDRSIEWLETCIVQKDALVADGVKMPELLAYIPVSNDRFSTKRGLERILEVLEKHKRSESGELPVVGFVLGGLYLGESPDDRTGMLSHVLPLLPKSGIRVLTGNLNLLDVIDAIGMGIDIIDSDYPLQLTNNGYASSFTYKYSPTNPYSGLSTSSSDSTKLNLRDRNYERDDKPLVMDCKCFSCSGLLHQSARDNYPRSTKDSRPVVHEGHRRAYIHHLLNVHELLGSALLQAHNVYYYADFLAEIRAAIERNEFTEYRDWFIAVNGL